MKQSLRSEFINVNMNDCTLSAVYTLIMNTLASIVKKITAVILYCVRNMS